MDICITVAWGELGGFSPLSIATSPSFKMHQILHVFIFFKFLRFKGMIGAIVTTKIFMILRLYRYM